MKEAVSVSLGSSQRDHKGVIDFGDEKVEIRREGTNGDMDAMIARYKELDGNVDAFGAGGYMFAFKVNNRIYPIRISKKITKHIHKTPVVDGYGVKETIERHCMQYVWDEVKDIFEELPMTALMTAGVDRYEMALSMIKAGFKMTFGDLAFGLGIPIKIRKLGSVHALARVALPIVSKFPLSWLYPLGEKQDTYEPKYGRFFKGNTLIAGDFLYTKKYAPYDMTDKVILCNTTTSSDIEEFKNRGVRAIITTTPDVQGRSFGTNGLEAAITAYAGKGRPLSSDEIQEYVDKLNIRPNVIRFD